MWQEYTNRNCEIPWIEMNQAISWKLKYMHCSLEVAAGCPGTRGLAILGNTVAWVIAV